MKILFTLKTIVLRTSLQRYFPIVSQKRWLYRTLSLHNAVQIDFTKVTVNKNVQEDKDIENIYNDPEESTSELEDYIDMFQDQEMPISVRNNLYPAPIDFLMTKLNSCGSVQEVFDLLKTHQSILRPEHIAQSVLILWDLQKMFYHVNLMNNTLKNQSIIITDLAENYFAKLSEHPDFQLLLRRIEHNCDKYDNNTLAIIMLYFDRIGMDIKSDTIQKLINKYNDKSNDVTIASLSRFTTILFRNPDLSSYYYIKNYIPTIFDYIENSKTLEEFKQCTTCLNNLNRLISSDVMDRYIRVLRKHLKSGFLNASDPKAILTIIMFLNYPQWRDNNTKIITEIILLLQDRIHLLNSYELLLLYEVFYKIQEPAIILNELQRHANRYLATFEDEAMPLLDVRLRLMLGLAAHSSHSQRAHYMRMLKQHTTYHLNRTSIFQFYKLLLCIKSSDFDVSKKLWYTIKDLLNNDEVFRRKNLLRVATSYLHYMQNIHGLRFYNLENCLNILLEKDIFSGYVTIYPWRFLRMSTFIIAFGKSKPTLEVIITHLERYKDRINAIDCFSVAKAFNFAKEIKNSLLTKEYMDRIENVINSAVLNNISDDMDINMNNMLIKCYIYNVETQENYKDIVAKLVDMSAKNNKFSTRIIKNLVFCLNSTQSLVPKVMDDMVDYIINSRDNVLGSNAEKVLYLCYQLGYQPKKSDEFFRTVSEIILRDQERFTGLSYLQSCLALCYFQSLPNSFIKQIFNTVFLDKLDNELANCYHKDIYPMRVRHHMMLLNRAVCIDYPELNVPWFHQKYITEVLKKANERTNDSIMHKLIQSYINKIIPDNEYLQQNVRTAYGYYINFVLNLDEQNQFIKSEHITDRMSTKRIALLLLKSSDFSNAQKQLMGKTLLKIRHLEILGYDVVLLEIPVWKNIISGYEKIAYLKTLIKVPNCQLNSQVSNATNL